MHIKNMEKVFVIEVCNKKNIPDVFGQGIKKNIKETGIQGIKAVLSSDIYRFEGISCRDEIIRIAEEILVDAVAQDYFPDDSNIERRSAGYRVIDVFYKKGVTDTVADTVIIAVRDAGIKTEVSVSTGKRYYLSGTLTEKDVETICMKVLVNPLIQDYSIVKGNNA